MVLELTALHASKRYTNTLSQTSCFLVNITTPAAQLSSGSVPAARWYQTVSRPHDTYVYYPQLSKGHWAWERSTARHQGHRRGIRTVIFTALLLTGGNVVLVSYFYVRGVSRQGTDRHRLISELARERLDKWKSKQARMEVSTSRDSNTIHIARDTNTLLDSAVSHTLVELEWNIRRSSR
jgi:hypothetical protein